MVVSFNGRAYYLILVLFYLIVMLMLPLISHAIMLFTYTQINVLWIALQRILGECFFPEGSQI